MAAASDVGQRDETSGLSLGAALGLVLGSERGEPLSARGTSYAVEATWLFPAGSAFGFELGLRGEVRKFQVEGAFETTISSGHELSALFGVRTRLLRASGPLGTQASIRGGLRTGLERRVATRDQEAFIGPHLLLAVERPLFDAFAVGIETGAYASFTPPLSITAVLGLRISAPDLM